jgi:hypothetical protein
MEQSSKFKPSGVLIGIKTTAEAGELSCAE